MKRLLLIAALLLLPSVVARAQTPSFIQPAACELGRDCWIVNYVDTDPAKGASADFRCGHLTYDDHNGTDFGIADLAAMETGVKVLAAAPGKVLRVRDGVADKTPSAEEQKEMLESDKGCGNGVFIDHGGGWQTIYCHMKDGSIAVKPDQTVKAGDKLGLIGQSGVAEFPHLHFGIFSNGRTIDPFTGSHDEKACGGDSAPLWAAAAAPQYRPFSIYAAGFKAGVPDLDAVRIDARGAESAPINAEALTFWAALYGVSLGDEIVLDITGPDGQVFSERTVTQEKDRARQFYYVGKRTKEGLAPGTYEGHVRITRKSAAGDISEETRRTLTVP